MAGLDDIVADAMNSFKIIKNVASNLQDKALVDSLERGKKYLKTKYHCTTESIISTHNCAYPSSDLQNEFTKPDDACKLVSEDVCLDYLELWEAVQKVEMIVTDNNFSKHTKYDVKNAVNDIVEFQKHLIRYVQQKKSKNFSLEQLHDELSAFWLKDFNQKILSMKFSEGQKEYFGKKGISLHVDRLIFRSEGSLKVVYFTIIYRCDQDVKDVLLINEDVIKEFVKSHPQIKKIYMKFDNAGCYHNSQSPEALFNISKKYGLTLQRYDFNEPA